MCLHHSHQNDVYCIDKTRGRGWGNVRGLKLCVNPKQYWKCRYNVTMGRVRVTIVAVEKQCILHILCVCVCVFVALVNQHVTCMRRVLLSPVAWHALQYFTTLTQTRRYFRGKKVTEIKMCVWIFSTTSV